MRRLSWLTRMVSSFLMVGLCDSGRGGQGTFLQHRLGGGGELIIPRQAMPVYLAFADKELPPYATLSTSGQMVQWSNGPSTSIINPCAQVDSVGPRRMTCGRKGGWRGQVWFPTLHNDHLPCVAIPSPESNWGDSLRSCSICPRSHLTIVRPKVDYRQCSSAREVEIRVGEIDEQSGRWYGSDKQYTTNVSSLPLARLTLQCPMAWARLCRLRERSMFQAY